MAAKIARLLIGIWVVFLIAYFGMKWYQGQKAKSDAVPAGVTGQPVEKKGFSLPFSIPGMKKAETETTAPQPPVPPVPEEPILPQVRTLKLKAVDFKDVLPVMGTIKGVTEIPLKFEINGVVKQINFREGERIKAGDLVASIDSKDVELKVAYAKSKFNAAQAAYNSVQKQLEIHRKLYEAGAIIKSKMEQIELEVESARYQLETTRSEEELASNEMRKTFLYAVKDGVMGARDAEEGEFVTPQDKVATIYEINEVFVEVGVVERDIDKIKLGQIARVFVDAYPALAFEGVVAYVYPVVEGKSRTLTVKIKVPNPKSLLLPGMFARAEMSIVELPHALMIPASALISSGGLTLLSVIPSRTIKEAEDELTGIAQIVKVTTGYLSSDYAQIIEGAGENDLVILEVQGELKENAPVKIVGTEELTF
ncbi:MAG TPA: efflux RND transporter periplasmic adaptor subunit [Candidatus Omnitrophota bacterium]|nr:efflux RND transporter periplasmic adaptor subunit [Candidatus Omnitrophota bacterium]HQO38254.1 efflux RND transporter periplasmic adaptor subunit [Candidatus Omnitrophota bacterium]